jgi:hypothetical protein
MSNTRLDLSSHIKDVSTHTVAQMTTAIRNAWAVEAKSRLNSTANAYINGIKSNVQGEKAEVYLEGSWANKLEHGFKPYDMKPMLQRSSKKKLSEESGQWYMHVPFRHTTPAATGRTGSKMPNSVYREARKLPQWGRMSSAKGSPSWGKFEGMQRVPESPTSKRSAYMTWRTVSPKSAPSAFVHPGFKGVHIAKDLGSQIEDTFSKLFQSNTDHALGKDTR